MTYADYLKKLDEDKNSTDKKQTSSFSYQDYLKRLESENSTNPNATQPTTSAKPNTKTETSSATTSNSSDNNGAKSKMTLKEGLSAAYNDFMYYHSSTPEKYTPLTPTQTNEEESYKSKPIATGLATGINKGAGIDTLMAITNKIADVVAPQYKEERDKITADYKAMEQYGQETAPIASTIGNVAGSVALNTGISKAISPVTGLVSNGLTKAAVGDAVKAVPKWVQLGTRTAQSALTFTMSDAIRNAGYYINGDMSGTDYIKSAGKSLANGTALGLVSGLTNAGGLEVLKKYKLDSPFAWYVKEVTSSMAGTMAYVGTNYALSSEKPSAGQVGEQMMIAFLTDLVVSGISTAQLNAQYKAMYEQANNQFGKDATEFAQRVSMMSADERVKAVQQMTERINSYQKQLYDILGDGNSYGLNMKEELNQVYMGFDAFKEYINSPQFLRSNVELGASGTTYAEPNVSDVDVANITSMLTDAIQAGANGGTMPSAETSTETSIAASSAAQAVAPVNQTISEPIPLGGTITQPQTEIPQNLPIEAFTPTPKVTDVETLKPIAETLGKSGSKAMVSAYDGSQDTADYAKQFMQVYNASSVGEPIPKTTGLTEAQKYAATTAGQTDGAIIEATNTFESNLKETNDVRTEEGRGVHLLQSSERNDGKDSTVTVSGMEEETGRPGEWEDNSRPKDGGSDSLIYSEKISAKDAGAIGGKSDNYIKILKSGETEDIRAAKGIAKAGGYDLTLFGGNNLDIDTAYGEVRAYVNESAKQMWIRADSEDATAKQFAIHEKYEGMFDRGEIVLDDVIDKLKETDPVRLRKMVENYLAVYGADDKSPEEMKETIVRQIFCDAPARINIFSSLSTFDELVETFQANARTALRQLAKVQQVDWETATPGEVSDTRNSTAPIYPPGKKRQEFIDNVVNKNAKSKQTYELFSSLNEFGKKAENQVNLVDKNGNTIVSKDNASKVFDVVTRYMTASDWNNQLSDAKFKGVAQDLFKLLPDYMVAREGDKATIEQRLGLKPQKPFNADGSMWISNADTKFKLKQSIMQKVVDNLEPERASNKYEVYGKTYTLTETTEGSGESVCVGGESYRRDLITERRRLYEAGELGTRSISSMSKDSWGALGWIRDNQKTGASGDYTTYCPQMMFGQGCWYCYRSAAMTTNVDNANVGRNVWYTGELLYLTQEDIQYMNKSGGLRIQSLGDWFDMYESQLVDTLADADKIGLNVKIITKEPKMIEVVAKLRSEGLKREGLFFNLSTDYSIEKFAEATDSSQPSNPNRPFMTIGKNAKGETDLNGVHWDENINKTKTGKLKSLGKGKGYRSEITPEYIEGSYYKRALGVEEAVALKESLRERYNDDFVNIRVVATNVDEFIYSLKNPAVNVVTGYHGNRFSKSGYERISSITGEYLVEVESLGNSGMPQFIPTKDGYVLNPSQPGKNKVQKELAKRIIEEGLQNEYFYKTCCVEGLCEKCEGKCGSVFRELYKGKSLTVEQLTEKFTPYYLDRLKTFDEDNIINTNDKFGMGVNDYNSGTKYSSKPDLSKLEDKSYAPTFYSQMQRTIDDYKGEKLGAVSVIPYLKGKGVKDEEIKWSGIEEFLEGKKSVTKQELSDFVKANELQIEEKTLGGEVHYTNEQSNELSLLRKDNEDYLSQIAKLWDGLTDLKLPYEFYETPISTAAVKVFMRKNGIDFYESSDAQEILDIVAMIRDNQRQIERIDSLAKSQSMSNWDDYKLDGGSNYREILFKIPGSDYSNHAMGTHWRESGILAHARVQDFDTPNGKMLFIDEIQSDWHNAGANDGYSTKQDFEKVYRLKKEAQELDYKGKEIVSKLKSELSGKYKFIADEFKSLSTSNSLKSAGGIISDLLYTQSDKLHKMFSSNIVESSEFDDFENQLRSVANILKQRKAIMDEVYELTVDGDVAVPDAPFRDGKYVEFVLKRLIREAAENGYDSIGWTTGEQQEDRWSSAYAEGYRIEYDQDIPKFLKKYGKKWGVEPGYTNIGEFNWGDLNKNQLYNRAISQGIVEEADQIEDFYGLPDGSMVLQYYDDNGDMLETTLTNGDFVVHTMTIPDSMKESVLYEGQPRFSQKPDLSKIKDEVPERTEVVNNNLEKKGKKYNALADKRDSGEKFDYKEFNNFYHAHKILSGKTDAEKLSTIESIRNSGFVSGGHSLVKINVMSANNDNSNAMLVSYRPKKGEYVLLVPDFWVENKNGGSYISDGYKPLPYEVVRVDYDSQPYYELYDKAYNDYFGINANPFVVNKYKGYSYDELNALRVEYGNKAIQYQYGENKDSAKADEYWNKRSEVVAHMQRYFDRNGVSYSSNPESLAELRRDNERLKERLAEAQRQTQLTKTPTVRTDDVKALTNRLLSGAESKADAKDISKRIEELGNYIMKGGDYDVLAYEDVKSRAVGIARDIIENASVLTNGDELDTFKKIKSFLKGQKFYFNNYEAGSRGQISDYKYFHSKNLSRFPLTKDVNARKIDDAWQELQEMFGESYFPDDIKNPAEQVVYISDMLDNMDAVYENPYDLNMAEAIEWEANEIVNGLLDESVRQNAPTYADRMNQRIENLKIQNAERLQAVREQRDAAIEKLKNRYLESAERKRTARDERAARQRLLKIAQRLSKKNLPEVNKALLNEYIKDLDLFAVNITAKKLDKLYDLSDWYEEQKLMNPDFVIDNGLEKELQRLGKKRIGNLDIEEVKTLTNILLNMEHQLQTYDKLIDTEEKRSTRVLGEEIMKDVRNSKGNDGLSYKLDTLFVNETLSPERLVHRDTGYNDNDPLYKATQDLTDGQTAADDYSMRANKLFTKWLDDKKFVDEISGKKAQTIKITGISPMGGAKTVEITPAMRMSLYLMSKDADNVRHIAGGGIRIPDIDLYRKGDYQEAYARGTTIKLTPSELRRATYGMTPEQQEFAMAAHNYFDGMSKKETGETFLKLNGFEMDIKDWYFPITTDDNFLTNDIEAFTADGTTLQNPGFTNKRVDSAKPIMLGDLNSVLNKSINSHAKYVGLAIPIRNFNKLWNAQALSFEDGVRSDFGGEAQVDPNMDESLKRKLEVTRINYEDSVRQSLENKWGKASVKYIEKFVKDLAGSKRDDDAWFNSLLAPVRSNYAGAVLTLNGSVALKQAASYPTAGAVLGFNSLAKALDLNRRYLENMVSGTPEATLELINKYTPIEYIRTKGYSSTELGDMAKSGHQLPKALNWVQAMDVATTMTLWKATEYYIRDNNPELKVGTDEYYQSVARMFERVIHETQPNYSVMQRPQILRSTNEAVKTLMMFKTQPMQNFNILYDAVGNMNAKRIRYTNTGTDEAKADFEKAKKDTANAVWSQALSFAMFAGLTLAWKLITGKDSNYRDKDNNFTVKSVASQLGKDIAGSAAGEMPFGAEVWSIVSSQLFGDTYYGVESITDSALTDLGNAVSKACNSLGTIAKDIKEGKDIDWNKQRLQWDSVIKATSKVAGMPYENVENLFNAAFLQSARAIGGEYYGNYALLRLTTDPESGKTKYYDNLFYASLHDSEAYNKILEDMLNSGDFTMKGITSAMSNREKKRAE